MIKQLLCLKGFLGLSNLILLPYSKVILLANIVQIEADRGVFYLESITARFEKDSRATLFATPSEQNYAKPGVSFSLNAPQENVKKINSKEISTSSRAFVGCHGAPKSEIVAAN